MTPIAPPGWYPDQQDPNVQRYWDGRAWTTHTQPAPTAPYGPPPSPSLRDRWKALRLRTRVLAVVAVLVLLIAVMPDSDEEPAPTASSADTVDQPTPSAEPAAEEPAEGETAAPEPEPEPIVVPGVRSKSVDAARTALHRAGLGVQVVTQMSWQPAGTVLQQRTSAGTEVTEGSRVTLVVAKPFPLVVGTVGRPVGDATAALKRAGWGVKVVRQVVTSGSNGVVLSQVPNGTQRARPGAVVTLTVANVVAPVVQAPAPSNCTPGYSPCLVPASDYDCSGGSGDGPRYAGLVKVTGSDPYDLDADGDGWGCD